MQHWTEEGECPHSNWDGNTVIYTAIEFLLLGESKIDFICTQWGLASSKSTIETLKQSVKYVQTKQ